MIRRSSPHLPTPPAALIPGVLSALALLAGCGRDQASNHETGAESGALKPIREITIEGGDQMRFSPDQFAVRAGESISVQFRNIGSLPVETMGHNWVLLSLEVRPAIFAASSVSEINNHYIAPRYRDQVIAATQVLGPGRQQTIQFTAPSQPGDYTFVCSFPGHTSAGMVGTMTVIP